MVHVGNEHYDNIEGVEMGNALAHLNIHLRDVRGDDGSMLVVGCDDALYSAALQESWRFCRITSTQCAHGPGGLHRKKTASGGSTTSCLARARFDHDSVTCLVGV